MIKTVLTKFSFASMIPKFIQSSGINKNKLIVIHSKQSQLVPQNQRKDFVKSNQVQFYNNGVKNTYLSQKSLTKYKISKDTLVQFSEGIQKQSNFIGLASSLLANSFVFNRKQKQPEQVSIQLSQFKDKQYILQLVNANIKAKQWANMRGDQAPPKFFLQRALQISKNHNLNITVIKGDQLLQKGFRLMHAVGRGSINQPIFINIAYNGNPDSQDWISFVGKGVCFDTGGYNLKPSTGIKDMHMDKHGATSVLSAIQTAAKLKLKVNLTASIGLVQNFISSNSYRPLDIIKSRKGLTVQIGNTDAEGRLVLADCMNWTQQNYKVTNLIQLSTLTGAIVVALGNKHAGLFSNSDNLAQRFINAGKQVNQLSWRMPVDNYHHQLIKSKHADITNSAGKPDAASSQAAAFLQKFVQKNVNWIHLDIAGTSMVTSQATGYGAKVLIQYLKNLC